jgi:threonine synthase
MVQYDFERLKNNINLKELGVGETLIERYRWLLPIKNPKRAISLHEKETPLVRCRKLGEELGLKNLYLKDESKAPTGSFKDRSMSVGISIAKEEKANTVIVASTGNAAASVAAHSAVARLNCVVLVPEQVSMGKLAQLAVYGAKIIRVRGSIDAALRLLKGANEKWGWTPMTASAAYHPRQVEGAKTSSYEISQYFGNDVPDCVIAPVGGGDNVYAMTKGYQDLIELGLISSIPRMIAVQAEGSAPLVRAFKTGSNKITPIENPVTVASGIRQGYPGTGVLALKAILDTKGSAIAVSDEQTLEAQRKLARSEGLFAEPTASVTVAALKQLVDDKLIDKDECIVCAITGHGLKEVNSLMAEWTARDAIEPTMKALEQEMTSAPQLSSIA